MPRLKWIVGVETVVLKVLLHVTSTLMNVVFVLIGWELGRLFVNFTADIYSMNNVFKDGLIRMAVALTVDLSVEHLSLLFMIFQTFMYQNQESQKLLEDYTTMVNSTQIGYL